MKYAGMPFGMWALFAGSFQKQLIAVLCYDADTAKAIQRFKTACGMSGDLSCSLTSFSSERSSAVQRWHQSAGWDVWRCLQVIAPMVRQLSLGELVQPSGTWLNDDTIGVFACPDGIRPVIFLLEVE